MAPQSDRVGAHSFLKKVTYMKATGWTISNQGKVDIFIFMVATT